MRIKGKYGVTGRMKLLTKGKTYYVPRVVVGMKGLILLNSEIAKKVQKWGDYVEVYYSNENGVKALALKFLEQPTEDSYPVKKLYGVLSIRAIKVLVEPTFARTTGIHGETKEVEFDEKNKMVVAIWK